MITFTAIPTEIARAYQAGGPDANGQPPERHISDGGGNPCRHCLGLIPKGAKMLVLAHRPFPNPQPYAEIGPIFLCASSCAAGGEWTCRRCWIRPITSSGGMAQITGLFMARVPWLRQHRLPCKPPSALLTPRLPIFTSDPRATLAFNVGSTESPSGSAPSSPRRLPARPR